MAWGTGRAVVRCAVQERPVHRRHGSSEDTYHSCRCSTRWKASGHVLETPPARQPRSSDHTAVLILRSLNRTSTATHLKWLTAWRAAGPPTTTSVAATRANTPPWSGRGSRGTPRQAQSSMREHTARRRPHRRRRDALAPPGDRAQFSAQARRRASEVPSASLRTLRATRLWGSSHDRLSRLTCPLAGLHRSRTATRPWARDGPGAGGLQSLPVGREIPRVCCSAHGFGADRRGNTLIVLDYEGSTKHA